MPNFEFGPFYDCFVSRKTRIAKNSERFDQFLALTADLPETTPITVNLTHTKYKNSSRYNVTAETGSLLILCARTFAARICCHEFGRQHLDRSSRGLDMCLKAWPKYHSRTHS